MTIDGENTTTHVPNLIAATPYVWMDPAKIPSRKFPYGRHYLRQFVSLLVAPGGMGKSSLALIEALAMVAHKELLGEAVPERCRVWLWNGEDPMEEFQRKIAAACLHFEIDPKMLEGWLFVDSGRDMPLVLVTQGRDGIQVNEKAVAEIIKTIMHNKIDVFIVDPFVLTHRVLENDNGAIDLVIRQWARIADVTGAAIGLVHHVRKLGAGQSSYSVDDSRGASSLLSAARIARVMNRMTKSEGEKAGVDNHQEYFRVENGKANLSPPSEHTDWRRIVSHKLENGDYVGVVERWNWPDPLADMTVADLITVQKAIDGKGYRSSAQSPNWVGTAIAQALDLDVDEAKPQIKSMIAIWTRSGALRVSRVADAKGTERPIVEVGQWANT